MGGSFDQLNDALFAQMERISKASGPDELEAEIARSKAVSELASNIIGNMSNGIRIMQMQERAGASMASLVGSAPKMLGCGAAKEASAAEPVPWDVADPWLLENAAGHSLSFLADRLRRPREEVADRCAGLGVAPVNLNVQGRGWREANAASKAKAGLL